MNRSLVIEVDDHVGPEIRSLIWGEFFASRERGISLSMHSPWLDQSHGVTAVSAHEGDSLVGCLIVKDYEVTRQIRSAMIGYVCVRLERRGRGIANALIDAAKDLAQSRGLDGLVLWTQNACIYRKHGFLPDNRDVLVQLPSTVASNGIQSVERHLHLKGRGIPAFSNEVSRLISETASAIILKTTYGPALAEWTGADTAVADLLTGVFTEPWWLNALVEDTLPIRLAERLGSPLRRRSSTRQVLPLNGAKVADIPGIRLIDRI